MTSALRVVNLSKTYPGTRALDRVELTVPAGEVHALVGGNGSGKSVLIRILAGVERADPGAVVEVAGRTCAGRHWTPRRARGAGLRVVHQEPAVFEALSVAENLALGGRFPTGALGRVRWRALHRRSDELLSRYRLPARTPFAALTPADRARVALVRAFADLDPATAGVLLLDEPATALPASETDALLADLRRYAADGNAVVFVSHRLDEVLRVADRVSVLRDGRLVSTVDAAGFGAPALAELITGRRHDDGATSPPDAHVLLADGSDAVVLEAVGITGGPLTGVDLRVRRGEVLGIAGRTGSGRSALLRVLFGASPLAAGSVTLRGSPVGWRSPADAMRAGIGYLPADRDRDGLLAGRSIRHNISVAQLRAYRTRLGLSRRREARDVAAAISRFGIRAAGDGQPVHTLSAGNQQKVMLARWLLRAPEVLLLDEPTAGVDVMSCAEIHRQIRQACAAGTAVVLVTNDARELVELSDRVAVLAGGRIVATVRRPFDADRLARLHDLEVPL